MDTSEQEQQQKEPREVILDSLPYIDYSHPDYEAYAATLIEAEMASFQPEPDAVQLRHLGPNPLDSEPTFGDRAPITKSEYAALVARSGGPRPADRAYDPTSHASAEMRSPPLSSGGATAATVADWTGAVSSARINLESNRSRLTNLELQSEFESDVWRHFNAELETDPLGALQGMLAAQRARVDDLNARRKTMQEEDAAPKLTRAGQRWEELVGSNVRIRDATLELEREVELLRKETADFISEA